MTESHFIVEEPQERDFMAVRPSRSKFFETDADSIEELHCPVRDAVPCHFNEGSAPKLIHLQWTRKEVIAP